MTRATTAASFAALLLLTLTACTAGGDPAPSVGLGSDADAILAEFGIPAPDGVENLIEQLESQPLAERPEGLLASVRVDELLLSTDNQEVSVPIPEGQFHLSVAPYLEETHECFYHSLTTCAGELAGEQMHVTITDDASGEVLVDEDVTTFENGYFDFWLPADRDITLRIDDGERSAEVPLGTRADDPTCVTTVQLA
jgi:hypothetical protein